MRNYDGAEVCELESLFLLNNLFNKFDQNRIGLFKIDGLAIFINVNGHQPDKLRKESYHLFKKIFGQ